jgi:hypothetical protein
MLVHHAAAGPLQACVKVEILYQKKAAEAA